MDYFLAGTITVIIVAAVAMAVYDYRTDRAKERRLGLRKEPRP